VPQNWPLGKDSGVVKVNSLINSSIHSFIHSFMHSGFSWGHHKWVTPNGRAVMYTNVYVNSAVFVNEQQVIEQPSSPAPPTPTKHEIATIMVENCPGQLYLQPLPPDEALSTEFIIGVLTRAISWPVAPSVPFGKKSNVFVVVDNCANVKRKPDPADVIIVDRYYTTLVANKSKRVSWMSSGYGSGAARRKRGAAGFPCGPEQEDQRSSRGVNGKRTVIVGNICRRVSDGI